MYEDSARMMSNVQWYWLLPLWCSHKTSRAYLCSTMTGATTGTGNAPGIYRSHMQMDQHHVESLEQRADS